MSSEEDESLNASHLERFARHSSTPPSPALLASPDDVVCWSESASEQSDEEEWEKLEDAQDVAIEVVHNRISSAYHYIRGKWQKPFATSPPGNQARRNSSLVDSPPSNSPVSSSQTGTPFSEFPTPPSTITSSHSESVQKKGLPSGRSDFENSACGTCRNNGIVENKNVGPILNISQLTTDVSSLPMPRFIYRRRASSDADSVMPRSSTTSLSTTPAPFRSSSLAIMQYGGRHNGANLNLNLKDYMTPQEVHDCQIVLSDNFDESSGNDKNVTAQMKDFMRSNRMIDIAFVQLVFELDPKKINAGNTATVNLLLFEEIMFCLKPDLQSGKFQLVSQSPHSGIIELRKLIVKKYNPRGTVFAMRMVTAQSDPIAFTIIFERKVQLTKWKNQLKAAIQKLDRNPDEAICYDRLKKKLATDDVTVETVFAVNSRQGIPSMPRTNCDSDTETSGLTDALSNNSFLETDVGILPALNFSSKLNYATDTGPECPVKHKYGVMVLLDLGDEYRDRWPLVARVVQMDNRRMLMRVRWFISGGTFKPFELWTNAEGRRMPTNVYRARSHFCCGFVLDEGGFLPRNALQAVLHRSKALGIDILDRNPVAPELTIERPVRKIGINMKQYFDVPWRTECPNTPILYPCKTMPDIGDMILVDLGENWTDVWPIMAQVFDITDEGNSLIVRMYWSYENRALSGRFTRWRHGEGKGRMHALRKIRTSSHYLCDFSLEDKYYFPQEIKQKVLDMC